MRKQALYVFAAIALTFATIEGAVAQSEYNNTKGGVPSVAKKSAAPTINRGVSSRAISSGSYTPKAIGTGKGMATPGGTSAGGIKGPVVTPGARPAGVADAPFGGRIATPSGPAGPSAVNTGPGTKGMGPTYGGRGNGGSRGAGGYGHGGGYGRVLGGVIGAALPGILMSLPAYGAPADPVIDDPTYANNPSPGRQPPQRTTRRGPSNVPPANERRMVPDEVVIEMPSATGQAQINALQIRHGLARIESQTFQLSGTTLYRWRIPDRRSVAAVVRELEGDAVVGSVQPNYLFRLQEDEPKAAGNTPAEGDPAQYELAKLHLPQAHAITKGDNVLVAVIDSGIDVTHPDLSGSVAESFDAITPDAAVPVLPGTPVPPHKHGTAIAGLIAAHGRLMGAAPNARILAIRAFDPAGKSAEGSTFNILKSLDRAAASGARVINMSFAGPGDPAIHRSLEAARKKGIVLVAASGNEGAKSPPLYPAADPNVIAVSATDADDKLFEQSNRGSYIAVAAPGAQILVAIPDSGFEVSSGTSYSAAEVSGIIALMLARNPNLTPERVRSILLATAKDLGPKGRDIMFGAGLADAYGALTAEEVPAIASKQLPVERVSNGTR